MKLTLNFFGKFLVSLLIFLSSGNQILFSAPISEIREVENSPVEQIRSSKAFLWADRENRLQEFEEPSVKPFLWADRENRLQEFEEPSVKPFFGCPRLKSSTQLKNFIGNPARVCFGYSRNIREALSIQIFPTHSFL